MKGIKAKSNMTTNCNISGCSTVALPSSKHWWENGLTIEGFITKMPYCERHRRRVISDYYYYHSNPITTVDFQQMEDYKEYVKQVKKITDEIIIPDLSNMICEYI